MPEQLYLSLDPLEIQDLAAGAVVEKLISGIEVYIVAREPAENEKCKAETAR